MKDEYMPLILALMLKDMQSIYVMQVSAISVEVGLTTHSIPS